MQRRFSIIYILRKDDIIGVTIIFSFCFIVPLPIMFGCYIMWYLSLFRCAASNQISVSWSCGFWTYQAHALHGNAAAFVFLSSRTHFVASKNIPLVAMLYVHVNTYFWLVSDATTDSFEETTYFTREKFGSTGFAVSRPRWQCHAVC